MLRQGKGQDSDSLCQREGDGTNHRNIRQIEVSVAKRYRILVLLLALVLWLPWQDAFAMEQPMDTVAQVLPLDTAQVALPADSVPVPLPRSLGKRNAAYRDSSSIAYADSLQTVVTDSLQRAAGDTLDLNRFNEWKPDPIRAMWLGMVFPGGGQMYNRKFWKLPIVYGGVVGCVYAVSWNAQMLRDYSQAYQDIMDTDPTTNSHLEMLPLGYDITGREDHFKSVFKRKKDFYRRNRDLSIFCIAGVYLLSIIDAYVDAELSTFDIGTDLSMTISPQMISPGPTYSATALGSMPGITIQLNY